MNSRRLFACMRLPPIAVRLCVLRPIRWHMEEKSALGPTRRVSLGMREARRRQSDLSSPETPPPPPPPPSLPPSEHLNHQQLRQVSLAATCDSILEDGGEAGGAIAATGSGFSGPTRHSSSSSSLCKLLTHHERCGSVLRSVGEGWWRWRGGGREGAAYPKA